MPKMKALFNVDRIVNGKDTPIEVSFLQDFDFTLRKMNEYRNGYYYKKVNLSDFDNNKKRIDVVCLDKLPEICTEDMLYSKTGIIYHTNDQNYYIVEYSDGKPSRRYKPSSLHCLRQMYYQLTEAELDKQTSKTGEFLSICESGTDRHKRIQNVLCHMRKYGIDCDYLDVEQYVKENNLPLEVVSKNEYETKVYDPANNIIFLCDGILKYKGKLFVFECKTESSFKAMNRSFVDDSHKYQAYTYAFEFGIDDVLFLYENRDLCIKKSFILHVTDENKKFIIDRVKDCDKYVEMKVVPPKQEADKKICQYCDYKTQCKVDKT